MFTLGEIAAAVRGELRGPPALAASGVSTDSRQVTTGQLFVALRGPNFDGHDFVAAAAAQGAVAAIVSKVPIAALLPHVVVGDTLRALGDLAAWHRRRFAVPVVAITGSVGKTTTKEMTAAILARRGPTLSTQGNLNNLIGVPLTIFGLGAEHRYAVLELGMSALGEITRLAEIARPDVGLVTNVGMAHAEPLGGVEGVALAKGELFDALGPETWAAVNLDDPYIAAMRHRLRARVVPFGRSRDAAVRLVGDVEVTLAGTCAHVEVQGTPAEITVPQLGAHQAENAVAAMAATLPLGATVAEMALGLAQSAAVAGRMTVRIAPGLTVLDDTYNANPRSVAMALETVAALARGARAVAVLGDMLELGERSAQAHRDIGRLASRTVAALFAFGPRAAEMAAGAREGGLGTVFHTADVGEMAELLRQQLRAGDVVLFKGSRGMRMERLVAGVTDTAAEAH